MAKDPKAGDAAQIEKDEVFISTDEMQHRSQQAEQEVTKTTLISIVIYM